MLKAITGALMNSMQRVIDDVPCIVDHDFLHGFGKRIQGALIDGLGLDSEHAKERATIYLMEDPDIVSKREDLCAKKQMSEQVLERLFAFDTRV